MIEVDGTAVGLEPNGHYVLMYDANRVAQDALDALVSWAAAHEINIRLLPCHGPVDRSAIVLSVEAAEKI